MQKEMPVEIFVYTHKMKLSTKSFQNDFNNGKTFLILLLMEAVSF